MAAWRMTQAAVAQYLGTDQTVKNPSRVVRLAGTVSDPPPHKQERGYVTELTSLNITGNGEVCGESFAASFPYTESEVKMPPPATRNPRADTSGSVPIYVIKAAFDAIPALMGKGHYSAWLDISMCAKAANPSCFPEFDEWQRRSDRYDPTEDSSTGRLAKTRAKDRISACSPMLKAAMSGGGRMMPTCTSGGARNRRNVRRTNIRHSVMMIQSIQLSMRR